MLKLTYSFLPISDVYVLAKTRDVTPLIFRVHIYFISAGSPELLNSMRRHYCFYYQRIDCF